ncbi:MAG: PhnD/SsuA/transferrin family substrate-binding protein [Desulfuromonadales bacterium]|nr:PhnD/SsuA/transferrin family substrate-binding protein [Desulfuromonadales bacterium]
MMTRTLYRWFLIGFALLLALPCSLSAEVVANASEWVRIGVLAKRGEEKTHARWDATADYLGEKLPRYRFEILPLDFDEIHTAVENGSVEFVLANSAFYVDLEVRYGVSRLATLKNRYGNESFTVFAGAIIVRADRNDIHTFGDLRGKHFTAVDERSFGGFHMAWRELREAGIDPYRDFSRLDMAGTHDAVVYRVLEGLTDAGTVRSDTLERMVQEEKIDLAQLRVLAPRSNPHFPFLHSTRLYPEWPFAKVRGVSDALAQQVAIALLEMPEESEVARISDTRGWTIPHEYQPVHDCLKALRISPYQDYGQVSTWGAVRRLWRWALLGALLLTFGSLTTLYLVRLNRKLTDSRAALAAAHQGLEDQVARRTRELEMSNWQLTQEIIEHQRAEAALSEERTKLELITSNLGAGFAVISRDYRTIMANKVIKDLFGEVEGQVCYQCYNQRDTVCPECGVRRIFEEGLEISIHEQCGYDAQGEEIWSQIIATPLRDGSGEVRAAIEVVVPITERKRAEQELRKALQEAEEARDRVDNIVKSVINGLIVTDVSGTVVSINRVASEMLNVSGEQVIGCKADDLFAVHGLDLEFSAFLKTAETDSISWEFELPGVEAGSVKVYQAWASAMCNQQGGVTGRVVVMLDVTRDRELTRLKDSFISMAAHELHTPLTAIIGYSELLLEAEQGKSQIGEHRSDFLQEILDKGVFLSRMVDELLDVSRIESGQTTPLQVRATDLFELLEKTVNRYRQFSPGHRFVLKRSGDEQVCPQVDAERIVQVLENLFSNAIKYSPGGGDIEVSLSHDDGNCLVSVEDAGIGMSEEEVARVFDRFYRSEKVDPTVRGLGLGMCIARQIITSHGGEIWVESRPGEGTRVSFTLPMVQPRQPG